MASSNFRGAAVHALRPGLDSLKSRDDDGSAKPPSGGGEDPPMTDYVTHAEFKSAMSDINERFVRVESRLDQTATKADVSEMKAYMADTKAELIKWVVGTAIALGAAAVTVMTFVLNNATPKAPASPPAPIIIQVPAPPAAPPPAK